MWRSISQNYSTQFMTELLKSKYSFVQSKLVVNDKDDGTNFNVYKPRNLEHKFCVYHSFILKSTSAAFGCTRESRRKIPCVSQFIMLGQIFAPVICPTTPLHFTLYSCHVTTLIALSTQPFTLPVLPWRLYLNHLKTSALPDTAHYSKIHPSPPPPKEF